MNKSVLFIARMLTAVVLSAALIGCALTRVNDPGGVASAKQVSDLRTSLSVSWAASTVASTLGNLGFQTKNAAEMWVNDGAVERSDVFSARVLAKTADGNRIVVDLRWKKSNENEVTITSDLDAEKHAYITDAIDRALKEHAEGIRKE